MGTEEFWVPAVLAAASAGGQYVNQQNANSRQQASEVQSIADQQKLQQQGGNEVKQLTNQIATDTPNQIAAKATGDYVSALRKNAVGTSTGSGNTSNVLFGAPTSSLPTGIKGSSRYNADTVNSQNQTQQYGDTLAGEMGNIDAATRQRTNEGLGMESLGTNLNLLGGQSYTQNFVDQLRSQAAGQQSPWLALLSSTLGGAANTMSKNVKGPAPAGSNVFSGNGTANGVPIDAGSGLTSGPPLA